MLEKAGGGKRPFPQPLSRTISFIPLYRQSGPRERLESRKIHLPETVRFGTPDAGKGIESVRSGTFPRGIVPRPSISKKNTICVEKKRSLALSNTRFPHSPKSPMAGREFLWYPFLS